MSLVKTFTVASLTADGNFPNVDMNAVSASGRPLTHALVITGSGSVAGVLTIYRGTRLSVGGTESVVFDTTAAATITVASGTAPVAESTSFEVTGCEHWKGVLSGLTGTATAHWVISYADRP